MALRMRLPFSSIFRLSEFLSSAIREIRMFSTSPRKPSTSRGPQPLSSYPRPVLRSPVPSPSFSSSSISIGPSDVSAAVSDSDDAPFFSCSSLFRSTLIHFALTPCLKRFIEINTSDSTSSIDGSTTNLSEISRAMYCTSFCSSFSLRRNS